MPPCADDRLTQEAYGGQAAAADVDTGQLKF